jgi:hypothetical protein
MTTISQNQKKVFFFSFPFILSAMRINSYREKKGGGAAL